MFASPRLGAVRPLALAWLGRHELSGAFGDSGILFPLAAGLIAVNHLNPTVVFVGAGFYYIAAGAYFRLPVPVQPLKAFSALAIAQSLSPDVIAAGGTVLGVAYLLLGLTGAIKLLARIVPLAVIKGIQLSLAVTLILSAWNLALKNQGLSRIPDAISLAPLTIPTGLVIGLVALAGIVILLRWHIVPASLTVIALGSVGGAVFGQGVGPLTLGPVALTLPHPALADYWTGLLLLAIPQLPLSIGNAMVSSTDVAHAYFGPRASRVTVKGLAVSMGIANLLVAPLGGMPMCHGAGGFTAHHRFGARTAGATLVIGVVCVILGVGFGSSALLIVTRLLPAAVLGALLAYVGWEHLQLLRVLRGWQPWLTTLVVGIASQQTNLAIGVVVGLAVWYGLELVRRRLIAEESPA